MCNVCGCRGYIEITYYEVCKNCSFTPEQIKNRAWNICNVCNTSGYRGMGKIRRIIKKRCPTCSFHNRQITRF